MDEDEDEEDDIDAEYLGAPSKFLSIYMLQISFIDLNLNNISFFFSFAVYESELAPEDCKENARQHPRADPVIAENHVLANTIKLASGHDEKPFNSPKRSSQMVVESSLGNIKTTTETTTTNSTMKKIQENEVAKPSSPSKTLTEAVTEKLAPVYSTVTDATHAIASKIQSLTVSAPSNPSTPRKASSPTIQNTCSDPSQPPKLGKGTEQIWDKGVSVKEYLMHKFEPGEDERALSQVLSYALSPRTKPGVGVVEKMREAVNSMLRAGEAPQPKPTPLTAKSSSQVEAAPQPVAAHSVAKSSSRAEKAPELVATKSSLRAEVTPQPMATKPSSLVEKAPQPVAAQLAAKSLSHTKEAPQAFMAVHLAAKPSSQAKAAPQALMATHLHAKPSLPAEATPQPMVTHLAAKSSSSAPIFTTTHRGELLQLPVSTFTACDMHMHIST